MRLEKVLRRVNLVKVKLIKIGLKFIRGQMLVTSEKLSHFSPTFFPGKINDEIITGN